MKHTIGVVGSGQMGRGIAQVAAQAGHRVLLADMSLEHAQRGVKTIAQGLEKLVLKQKLTSESAQQVMQFLEPVANVEAFAACSMVIEAATEQFELKAALFEKLGRIVSDTCVLASNTSSISITRIAAKTHGPERVIGMHFMNPVPVMKLVEVIRGVATSDATYQTVVDYSEQWGKTVVTSADYPGFIVNRILMPMINEAIFALMEGVASAPDIDAAMKLGTNQPMGPLTLADFIGLDTCLAILEVMHADLGDSKYRPCPLLRRMVQSGRLGVKSGHGFFQYSR